MVLAKVLSESHLPSSVFDGEQASAESIRGALKQHSWLRLACHGRQDLTDPLKSAFALYDGPPIACRSYGHGVG